jgi:uncharacterized protein (DUF58 family)
MEKDSFYQKVRQLKIVSTKMLEGLYGGNYRSVFKGPGLEFDEVRNYVVNDDARFIDWNVSSRMGDPFTKTFREEREMVLMILVDVSPSLNMGTDTTTNGTSSISSWPTSPWPLWPTTTKSVHCFFPTG